MKDWCAAVRSTQRRTVRRGRHVVVPAAQTDHSQLVLSFHEHVPATHILISFGERVRVLSGRRVQRVVQCDNFIPLDQCHAYLQCVASDATTQPKVADFGHPRDANKNVPCGNVAVNELMVGHVNHSGEHVMQHTECLEI